MDVELTSVPSKFLQIVCHFTQQFGDVCLWHMSSLGGLSH